MADTNKVTIADTINTSLDIAALKALTVAQLAEIAKGLKISGYHNLRKQELIFEILKAQTSSSGERLERASPQ